MQRRSLIALAACLCLNLHTKPTDASNQSDDKPSLLIGNGAHCSPYLATQRGKSCTLRLVVYTKSGAPTLVTIEAQAPVDQQYSVLRFAFGEAHVLIGCERGCDHQPLASCHVEGVGSFFESSPGIALNSSIMAQRMTLP